MFCRDHIMHMIVHANWQLWNYSSSYHMSVIYVEDFNSVLWNIMDYLLIYVLCMWYTPAQYSLFMVICLISGNSCLAGGEYPGVITGSCDTLYSTILCHIRQFTTNKLSTNNFYPSQFTEQSSQSTNMFICQMFWVNIWQISNWSFMIYDNGLSNSMIACICVCSTIWLILKFHETLILNFCDQSFPKLTWANAS